MLSGSRGVYRFGHSDMTRYVCIYNMQNPGALHVEQMVIHEWKRLGDGTLCKVTRCESIS
jgi:hypothetical protein